jgi:Stress responsive A/B Barrel Domain
VIAHVVLFKPRADLTLDDRARFVAALKRAVSEIPSIRHVRVGRRVRIGADYERLTADTVDFLAVIEFEDLRALRAYLSHPVHDELGRQFNASLQAAQVYDFELVAVDQLDILASDSGRPGA